jgi:hypothetical protein
MVSIKKPILTCRILHKYASGPKSQAMRNCPRSGGRCLCMRIMTRRRAASNDVAKLRI